MFRRPCRHVVRGHTLHFHPSSCVALFSSSASSSGKLRKQMSPFVKMIHPDFFLQHSSTIQKENMTFLQLLNSLVDNIEHMKSSSHKRNMVDVTTPFLSSYQLAFHVKEDPKRSDQNEGEGSHKEKSEQDKIKSVKLKISVPRDLTVRQSINSVVMQNRIKTLLHRIGGVFEAVDMPNPWEQTSGDGHDDHEMTLEQIRRRAYPSSAPKGFRQRTPSVSVDDPRIQAMIEERMVEKTLSEKVSSIYGGVDNSKLVKKDVDIFIRNGNVLTTKLSPVNQLHAIKRLRNFLFNYGHLINFSFSYWANVLVLVDGTMEKDSFKTESLKKRILVVIPSKFSSPRLVKYLHKAVPQARVTLPSIEDINE